jgi:hypothetical protein
MQGSFVGKVISRRIAFEHGGSHDTTRAVGGNVFHAVHRTIYSSCKDRVVQSPDKDSLTANLMERYSSGCISMGGNDYLLGFDTASG